MSVSVLTRVRVPDFDSWKAIFDRDPAGARATATGYRLYRGLEDPNEVFVHVDFPSAEDASAARERLLAHGVLDRFPDRTGPTVVEQAEAR